MFTLNQTFTINMCVTHCNLKSISFLASLVHSLSLPDCVLFTHFFRFLHISFFFIYIMRNWKHHFSCCVFLFFWFYYQFSNFILLCAFVKFILRTFLYTQFVCCVYVCFDVTLSQKLSQTLRFFRSFPTFFIIYSYYFMFGFVLFSICFSLSLSLLTLSLLLLSIFPMVEFGCREKGERKRQWTKQRQIKTKRKRAPAFVVLFWMRLILYYSIVRWVCACVCVCAQVRRLNIPVLDVNEITPNKMLMINIQ